MTTRARGWKVKGWPLEGVGALLMEQVGFEPTGVEQARILVSEKRFEAVSGGDQSGKSTIASKKWLLRWTEDMAVHGEAELLYWLVAVDYEGTRREFEYILEDLGKMGLPVGASKRVDPGYISLLFPDERKPRLRVETKSGKDPRSLRMHAPNGIIICEASQVDLETYWRCQARVAPKRGWLFMSGSMDGSLGWWPSLITAWLHGTEEEQSFLLPTTSNIHLFPGGESNPEIQRLKRESSDTFFMERVMGVPVPPKGLVFKEFRPDVHIREDVEYVGGEPVYLWVDPGYAHAYAVEVVQIIEGVVRVFDEIYERGLVTEQIIEMAQTREWWKDHSPTGVIDVAGYQHQAMSAPAEVWLSRAGVVLNAQKIRVSEGTERMRSFLKVDPLTNRPRILFSPKCKGVLSELGAYPNPFDGQTRVYQWKMDREGNVVGEEPDDRHNDGCKAIIYGLVERFGLSGGGTVQYFPMTRYGGDGRPRLTDKRKIQVPR